MHCPHVLHLYGSICHTVPAAVIFVDSTTGKPITGTATRIFPALRTKSLRDWYKFLSLSIILSIYCSLCLLRRYLSPGRLNRLHRLQSAIREQVQEKQERQAGDFLQASLKTQVWLTYSFSFKHVKFVIKAVCSINSDSVSRSHIKRDRLIESIVH